MATVKEQQDKLYSERWISILEKIFGPTYVSPGGEASAERFCSGLELGDGSRVLDVGCGLGGPAIFMARRFGAEVTGVDASGNMVKRAERNRWALFEVHVSELGRICMRQLSSNCCSNS